MVVVSSFRLCWVCKCTEELDTLVGSIDDWPEGKTVFRTNLSCHSVHMYILFIDVQSLYDETCNNNNNHLLYVAFYLAALLFYPHTALFTQRPRA